MIVLVLAGVMVLSFLVGVHYGATQASDRFLEMLYTFFPEDGSE